MPGTDAISAALDVVTSRFDNLLRASGRRRGLSEGEMDELVQDVRVRLWRALGDAEKIRNVGTSYVYRVACTAALDMVRRRRWKRERSIEALDITRDVGVNAPEGAWPDDVFEQRELVARIERALIRLSEPREVVVRLHLSGYGRLEIARLLGWTEPKVRNLVYRGLTDLRKLLRTDGIGRQRVR